MLDHWIPLKHSFFAERIVREVTQRKLKECWKLRKEELAMEERK
jgi:hypothetical protein